MLRDYPDLYLLRHGQTVWNAAGRMQGRKNSDLTQTGRQQARAQHATLNRHSIDPHIDLWCSPAGRARETAGIALAGRSPEITYDPRLLEVSVGVLEGLTIQEMKADWPEVMNDRPGLAWQFHAPGGETFAQMSERVQSWLDNLTAPALVVTHGVTSRFIRMLVLGLDFEAMQALPGGQGVIYCVKDGKHHQLEA